MPPIRGQNLSITLVLSFLSLLEPVTIIRRIFMIQSERANVSIMSPRIQNFICIKEKDPSIQLKNIDFEKYSYENSIYKMFTNFSVFVST